MLGIPEAPPDSGPAPVAGILMPAAARQKVKQDIKKDKKDKHDKKVQKDIKKDKKEKKKKKETPAQILQNHAYKLEGARGPRDHAYN